MGCTTILVGKKASYDGSTMVARNADSPDGVFTPKRFIVINEKVKVYTSVLSKFSIEIDKPFYNYTALPDYPEINGIWATCGVNTLNVSVNATETITANDRIVSSNPMVQNGISEEDIVSITLPYITSARDGVKHLGSIIEKYGTYEKNGIAFQDENEIWWLETIGGNNYIAKKLPDDCYSVIANQMGIDFFDFEDAFKDQKEHICSKNIINIIKENHLDLTIENSNIKNFNTRYAFSTNFDNDFVYNTPRVWILQKYFNPSSKDIYPDSSNLSWCRVPERKITVYDVKYALSNHYQGTEYDSYSKSDKRNQYRVIGINRTSTLAMAQIRPYVDNEIKSLQWVAYSSNVFNTLVPFYTNVRKTPEYVSNTPEKVDTKSMYWQNRIIAALADAHYNKTYSVVERYQRKTMEITTQIIKEYDKKFSKTKDIKLLEEANQKISDIVQEKTDELLSKVLYIASMNMKNVFRRGDM